MAPSNVLVFGRRKAEILPAIAELGLRCVEENPDVVISYGGDGTLLGAEREWPGVPKVALRDSRRCRVCSHESNETILRHLVENTLKRTEFIKLRATVGDCELTCLNDIILHKMNINAGVRYSVWIDDEHYGHDEIVGDGLVVATPFGSAAYYRSITHSTLRVGIGLAFNNTIEPINHLVLSEDSAIRVLITRGPAQMAVDNNPGVIPVDRGDQITIRRADHNAVILAYDWVRYPADQFIFHQTRAEAEADD
jgi:NAD+ kinase